MAVAAGKERASLRLGIGLASSIGGAVWLAGIGRVDLGAVIVLANSLSYAGYVVFSRGVIQRLGALTVVTWIFTWGGLLFAPLGLPALFAGAPEWTPRGWAFIGYIVVMPTIVAYACTAWALGRSNATLVTIYIYVQPVIAGLLARVQLGHPVEPRMIGAAALIAAGVAIVATRRDPEGGVAPRPPTPADPQTDLERTRPEGRPKLAGRIQRDRLSRRIKIL